MNYSDSSGTGFSLSFDIPKYVIKEFEESLEDISQAIVLKTPNQSAKELDKNNQISRLIIYVLDSLDIEIITARINILSAKICISMPQINIEEIPDIDWAAKSQQSFLPLRIGGFYIHPKHIYPPYQETTNIQIDAGAAFGSGDHSTTRGCLIALEKLNNDGFQPEHILDMGTGSGILAIAAAKLWSKPVLAVDIDPTSISVADLNFKINGCSNKVKSIISDRFLSPETHKPPRFSLIMVNILAGPLVALSSELSQHLSINGYAILSGLLSSQEKFVLEPYTKLQFTIHQRFEINNWTTLILKHNNYTINGENSCVTG